MADLTEYADLPLPAERVWDVVGDFGALRKWATAVHDERTESSPDGPLRIIDMGTGAPVRELRIAASDFSYSYTVLDRPEMTEYRGTVAVIPLDSATARIVLIIHAVFASIGEDELVTRYTRFLRGNLKAMRRALGLPD